MGGAVVFVSGQAYRRQDLHTQYGGQRQGGISTPARYPFILLFTSETGTRHGYDDHWTADGRFLYTGEGQFGNMELVRGNKAIRDHQDNGKQLLLFENLGGGTVRYVGEFKSEGYQETVASDTEGRLRKAIVFRLARV